MAHIPAKLLSRLVQLESRMAERVCPSYFIVTQEIPQNRQCSLGDGERIVLDCYRHKGFLVEARQRVTTDPTDHGRRCDPDSYLADVLEEIHSNCCYRDKPGFCNSCFGTPLAGT
jgi:hypothetical protein